MIMGTNAQQGAFLNIVVGIIGAVLGGWLMSFFGQGGISGFNLYSFVVALIGAVVLLALTRMFRGATRT